MFFAGLLGIPIGIVVFLIFPLIIVGWSVANNSDYENNKAEVMAFFVGLNCLYWLFATFLFFRIGLFG